MKIKRFILVVAMALFLPCAIIAQPALRKVIDKYGDQEGFTSITISGELIKLIASGIKENDGSIDMSMAATSWGVIDGIPTELVNDILKINSIKLLNTDLDFEEGARKRILSEINQSLSQDKSKYTELMQVNSDGQKINILALKNKAIIEEIIVYFRNDDEYTLIHIEGALAEGSISKAIAMLMKSL